MTEDDKGCAECTPSGSGNCTFGCFAEPGARPYDKGGIVRPAVTWVHNDSGEDEEVRPA